MLYVIFAALSDAQAFVASINQAMGLPRGETQTWANPLALATPAGACVVPVDPAQRSKPCDCALRR